jgi:hypothetical protein
MKSNGYIPSWPLGTEMDLGDLFLMRSGKMVKIGNVLDQYFGVFEDVSIQEDYTLDWESWNLDSGVQYSFFSKEIKDSLGYSNFLTAKQGLSIRFDHPGAYLFRIPEILHRSIENFYDLKFKLLQELASEKFSFKEIFVVTSLAKTPSFGMMMATGNEASAVISFPDNQALPYSLDELGNKSLEYEMESLNNVGCVHIGSNGGQMFFKAKKMEASPRGIEIARDYIKNNLPESMQKRTRNILNYAPTEIFPSFDIYPAKVHDMFHFRDMNIEDVNVLFGG